MNDGSLERGPEKSIVTISVDRESAAIFRDLKKDGGISQSKLMRTALKFYSIHKALFESVDVEKIYISRRCYRTASISYWTWTTGSCS